MGLGHARCYEVGTYGEHKKYCFLYLIVTSIYAVFCTNLFLI